MLTLEDILCATRAVAWLARAGMEPQTAARLLRDRTRRAAAHVRSTGRADPGCGDGSVASAAWALRPAPGAEDKLSEAEMLRAGAAVCAAWAEDSA